MIKMLIMTLKSWYLVDLGLKSHQQVWSDRGTTSSKVSSERLGKPGWNPQPQVNKEIG